MIYEAGWLKEDMRFILFFSVFLALVIGLPVIFRKKFRKWSVERPLLVYSLKRILYATITLVLVITVVFLLLRLFPRSNYLDNGLMSKMKTAEEKEAYIRQVYHYYGFDKPIWEQMYRFFKNIFPFPKTVCQMRAYNIAREDAFGNLVPPYTYHCAFIERMWVDLGTSVQYEKVVDIIIRRAPVSFAIAFPIALLSMLIGYPLGIIMAKNKGKLIDQIGLGYEAVTFAIPAIVLYGIMQTFFLKLKWFPPIYDDSNILSLFPPIIIGVIVGFSAEAYFIRRYIVDQMNNDYVKFARAKGLSENRIMFTHVLRNALVYIIRYIPGTIILSFTGGYFIERLFSVPGMGSALIDSMKVKPDNNLVQGLVLIYAIMSLVSYLLADLIVLLADPRISYTKNK